MKCKKFFSSMSVPKIIALVMGGIALAVLLAFLFGLAVQYLWNWLMPELFGLQTIGYWQAFGLVLLAKFLFGSFGHGHGHDHDEKCDTEFKLKFEKDESSEEFKTYWQDEGKESFNRYLEEKNQKAE